MCFIAVTFLFLLTACVTAPQNHALYRVTFDPCGRVLARSTPIKTTDYDYDAYGRVISKAITDTTTS